MGNEDVIQLAGKGTITILTKKGTKFVHNILFVLKLDRNKFFFKMT